MLLSRMHGKEIETYGRDKQFSRKLLPFGTNNINYFSLCVLMVLIRVGLRLGEYDLNSEEDCSLNNSTVQCPDAPRDYAFSEIVLHSGFKPQDRIQFKNDVALIRLRSRVDFSGTHANIQPGVLTYTLTWSSQTHSRTYFLPPLHLLFFLYVIMS